MSTVPVLLTGLARRPAALLLLIFVAAFLIAWGSGWIASRSLLIPAVVVGIALVAVESFRAGASCGRSPAAAKPATAPIIPAELPRFELSLGESSFDLSASGRYEQEQLISRLEPSAFRWVGASAAMEAYLGWPLQELRSKSFLDIVHPELRELARDQLRAALIKGEAHRLIYRIKTAKRESRAVEMNVGLRFGPDMAITHLRCHLTDVTDKIRAGRELRRRTRELTGRNDALHRLNRELEELKDRYSDLYHNAPAMYFSVDQTGAVLDCNDTLLRTLGYQRQQVVGGPYSAILHPSVREPAATISDHFFKTGHVELESQWVKSDGSEIDVWLTGTAVRDGLGEIVGARIVANDVTARKRLESELTDKNESLARANDELSRKNKELDEFTYAVSHDLREPLRSLIAFSEFLIQDHSASLSPEGLACVRQLAEAAGRMRSLIQDLLSLSRAGRIVGDFTPVDLNELIRLIRHDLTGLIRQRHAELRIAVPLPIVWGDRARLGELLSNLISNGWKYNRSERPWVEVAGERDEADPGLVKIRVRDNGIGVDPRFYERIFQLFGRLHPREEYEGTGAGLAICKKIAEAHGGRIWVESELGAGSAFFVTLPAPQVDAS